MQKSSFIDFAEFSKIKTQKSAILDCAAILKDCTTKQGKVF
jgi:hypothetical protein